MINAALTVLFLIFGITYAAKFGIDVAMTILFFTAFHVSAMRKMTEEIKDAIKELKK